jgi:hypothetical protein
MHFLKSMNPRSTSVRMSCTPRGECIIPWAVIPAAAITGTDPVEVARRNLFPTLMGFNGVVIVAIFML